MSAKSHIWPAYVDMMTVILMVYILINVMFSAVIANADLTNKQDTKSQQNSSGSSSTSKQGTLSGAPYDSVITLRKYDAFYKIETGDMILNLNDEANGFKNPDDVNKLKAWLSNHKNNKGKVLFGVFINDDGTKSMGALLRWQTMLYYKLLALMKEEGIDLSTGVSPMNAPPSSEYNSMIKLRFESCDNNKCASENN